jgi:hypothetical protein
VGYRGGLINNMAASNMKEYIDAVLDRVTVHDSEIPFRLRGPGARAGAECRGVPHRRRVPEDFCNQRPKRRKGAAKATSKFSCCCEIHVITTARMT